MRDEELETTQQESKAEAAAGRPTQDPEKVWDQYERGVTFKQQLDLYDTVKVNEDFYIGKQWEGVNSNGLPTPVFNYIKRIILYLVASTATDSLKINASPLASTGQTNSAEIERLCGVVNEQFEAVYEQTKMGKLVREFMRAAAVDGDSCIYCWFDPEVETGQEARGAIRAEILENTRVIFGNPNSCSAQDQPYIIVSRRELMRDVKEEVRANGGDPDAVQSDSDEANDRFDALTDGKVTTLMKFWKSRDTGTVWRWHRRVGEAPSGPVQALLTRILALPPASRSCSERWRNRECRDREDESKGQTSPEYINRPTIAGRRMLYGREQHHDGPRHHGRRYGQRMGQ